VQSRRRTRLREAIALRETSYAEAAQPTLKNVGRIVLIHTLALKSRVNPKLTRIVCGRQNVYAIAITPGAIQ
jgi:hypothetical protein